MTAPKGTRASAAPVTSMTVMCYPVRDTPPDAPPPATWYALLARIPEDDGDWFLVGNPTTVAAAHTAATFLRTGRRRIPPGRWEFRSGRTKTGEAGLWARRVLGAAPRQ